MSDVAFKPARELAEMLRAREIGARELLDHYLERVERFNPRLNAIVKLDVERARKRADAADAALARREVWGPLHGLPMTMKELFEVDGMSWTFGDPQFAERMAEVNSPVVQRLIDAGAVIFGLTNSPLNGMDVQTYNSVYGTTNNPWDTERAPGGSSGGTAVALATGMSALDLGSDIGGSIRNPAHYTGVYGHKPSFGIVPRRRVRLPGLMAVGDLSVAGPLGRSADDLDFELSIVAGVDADRELAWRLELPPSRRASLQAYRVAAWLDDPVAPVDARVRDKLESAVEALRAEGVSVDEKARPEVEFAEANRVYRSLLTATSAQRLPEDQFHLLLEAEDALPTEDAEAPPSSPRSAALRHREWLQLNETREQMRARWEQFFERYDVLLTPVTSVTAIPHDHREFDERSILVNGEERRYWEQISWVGLATLVYLPASVAPVGLSADGLPVGIQIIAPYLEDRRLGELIGGYEPPPGFD